ncbi:hypothetical protein INN71_17505 [Nocardioides sp. ChNu-153]|uniref:hypothetical protein n=1 Tax=unclassified Nocardioides TaxID=2615069 RepID=UPI0024073BBB|nr:MULTISPECIES: hypothetical protein [unclassified Nocardioides]MDF9716875.1 hypothetical protein [Nocardioides sp. ChNu-99]MDN7123181.1 hypothetical protein [Nocardioides sp. ChNu-153]
MSIVLPTPAEVPVLHAEPALVATYGEQHLVAAAEPEGLADFARAGARVGDWQGRGAAAYHEANGPIAAQASALAAALRRLGEDATTHGGRLDELRSTRDGLVARREGLLARQAELLAASPLVLPTLLPVIEAYRGDVAAFDAEVQGWWEEVYAEERRMAQVLDGVLADVPDGPVGPAGPGGPGGPGDAPRRRDRSDDGPRPPARPVDPFDRRPGDRGPLPYDPSPEAPPAPQPLPWDATPPEVPPAEPLPWRGEPGRAFPATDGGRS